MYKAPGFHQAGLVWGEQYRRVGIPWIFPKILFSLSNLATKSNFWKKHDKQKQEGDDWPVKKIDFDWFWLILITP